MQQTLRGIVLRTVKYGDNSMIVDLFTESHGRMSFMASTVRAKRSVRNVSFWQPLSMVEFSAELLPNGGKLPRPTDVRTYYNYIDLPFSPVKSTLALFLAEFLSAALREEKENAPLYRYIESSLQWLDLAEAPASIANFHLAFLMHLSRFIGIYPNLELPVLNFQLSTFNSQLYFDLLAGTYCDCQPPHAHFLRNEEARALPVLFRMDYATLHLFRLSRRERMRILQVLNEYYRLHVPNFPELKSLEVLQEFYDSPA
jgi:DNA repair protein RecO (recombination protein O)